MTRERRALIVRGGWDGHQPVAATDLFIPYLAEQGFAVRVEDSPAPYADAGLMAGATTTAVRPWAPWNRPVTTPAVWTRQWGSGRVFVATPGHQVAVLRDPNVRTIIERGLLWAAR